ncbi:HU family DNA-binding protein [Parabacteroides pacaensis]|uniref:HU family DNA-binding protein n=1 Tax=Parabacteroides pacaensis TaxID=2086575 RepID=UPI00131C1FFC|nr:HU family DNA-binding protein [Parabacteroides pacaensis]
MKLKKADLVKQIAEKRNITIAEARRNIDEMIEIVRAEICKGNSIELSRLGYFYQWKRETSLLPKRNRESIHYVPEKYSIGFTPSVSFKKHLNLSMEEKEEEK